MMKYSSCFQRILTSSAYRYQSVSLAPERGHWINLRRTPRRNPAGQQGNENQQERNARKRQRIGRAHAEQQGFYPPRQRECRPQPDYDAEQNQLSPLCDDQHEHITAFRAERQPDANLMCPLRDAATDHAVNADGGQRQRDSAEYAQQDQIEAL